LFKTTDGGSAWNKIDSYLNGGYALAIAPTNSNVIFAGGSNNNGSENVMAVCFSTDGGSTWNRVELTSNRGYAYAIAIHPNNPDVVLMGGYCYTGSTYLGKIFKTTDGGANWTDVSQGVGENYNYVYSLVIDPNAPSTFYAGTRNGVYKSVDGGANWVNLNSVCRNVYGLAIHPRTSVIYAAGYGSGVYSSADGGSTWTAMNDGLTSYEIECIILDSHDNLLFVGTSSEGVFRYDVSTDIEPVISKPVLPTELRLLSNYPNPFNMETKIRVAIPRESFVTISIYNALGQLQSALINNILSAGNHVVSWNANDAPSGIYFVVLKSGNEIRRKKICLLK
jgi:hypothetical protein